MTPIIGAPALAILTAHSPGDTPWSTQITAQINLVEVGGKVKGGRPIAFKEKFLWVVVGGVDGGMVGGMRGLLREVLDFLNILICMRDEVTDHLNC